MNFIINLILGGLSGFVAGKLMGSDGGLIRNIILGLIGGVVGGVVLGLIGLGATGWVGEILVSIIGACILIAVGRVIFK